MDQVRKKYINLALNDSVEEKNQLYSDNKNGIFCFRRKNYIIYCENYKNLNCGNKLKECIENFVENEFKPFIENYSLEIEDIDLNNNLLYITCYDQEHISESVGQTFNYYMNGTVNNGRQFVSAIYEQSELEEQSKSPEQVIKKIKSYFDDNYFKKFTLKTDAGNWTSKKVHHEDNSLQIIWDNEDSKHQILTDVFPDYTNKIRYQLKDDKNLKRQVQAFKIPIKSEDIQEFFSKIYLNHLRHFINKEVIKVEPFNNEFVFWEPHKLDYDYSFSAPNRNEIIHDLLNFINIRDNPVLDKFFEENELRHKQGYLQTLLNAANKAGIVDFERDGNSIIAKKGKNYRKFLDGKIRRV